MNKSGFKSLKSLFSSFSSLSYTLLSVGLPIVLTYLIALLVITLSSSDIPSNVLAHIYAPSLEHIVMALTLTVIGALTADLAERSFGR